MKIQLVSQNLRFRHGVYEVIEVRIQNSAIKAFFTTDTIALRKECEFEKMQEVSIAGDMAKVLKEIPVRD